MRRVRFSPSDLVGEGRQFWDEWHRDADDATTAMLDEHSNGGRPAPDHDQIWGRLKRWIADEAFARKCGYCEGDVSAQASQHAEHWRPKNKVTTLDADGKEVVVSHEGRPHPGYWWLAYDWRNLVPACEFCNTAGAKGTKFPIAGRYVFSPHDGRSTADLDRVERPYLLHPYGPLDPRQHIGFASDGTATARNRSEYGYWTIKVMDLNRESLVNARQQRQDEAVDAFGLAVLDSIRANRELDAAMERWAGDAASYNSAVRDRLMKERERLQRTLGGLF